MVARASKRSKDEVLMTFKSGLTEVDVYGPEKDSSDWQIVAQEAYRPDKNKFVTEAFSKTYKDLKGVIVKDGNITNYEKSAELIYKLCSRSSTLNTWLQKVNLEYAKSAQLPLYYQDLVSPEDYEKVSEALLAASKHEQERAVKLAEAAKNYEKEVNKINSNANELIVKTLGKDKSIQNHIAIINLKTTDLPLTLQIAIEKFTPAKGSDSPSQREYAREILIEYKQSLFDCLEKRQTDKDFDIQKVIEANRPK